jgi:hypothetical protein
VTTLEVAGVADHLDHNQVKQREPGEVGGPVQGHPVREDRGHRCAVEPVALPVFPVLCLLDRRGVPQYLRRLPHFHRSPSICRFLLSETVPTR